MKYLIAKVRSVSPPLWLAISHETGYVIAESEILDELHEFMNAHGWAYEEI